VRDGRPERRNSNFDRPYSVFCDRLRPTDLQAEPPPNGLPLEQIILVDDGKCPKGQMKQVSGGGGTIGRIRKCVKKVIRPGLPRCRAVRATKPYVAWGAAPAGPFFVARACYGGRRSEPGGPRDGQR
jgi:hypothetical protein